MTYFVSRHAGARAWVERQGVSIDRWLAALDPGVIAPGDRVLGTLPVHLAAGVCARGGRYFHLELELPARLRGVELDADMMTAQGARLREFRVTEVAS